MHSLLASANLCLVPSHYEGSSLTALEALAHRLPVVATPVGGLPDKVLPGQTGFLAAARTPPPSPPPSPGRWRRANTGPPTARGRGR